MEWGGKESKTVLPDTVCALWVLCKWASFAPFFLSQGVDGPSLRVESLGKSDDGSTYWYFYGTRLYAELRDKKPKKAETSQSTPKGKGRSGKARGNSARKNNAQVQEEEEPNARWVCLSLFLLTDCWMT